LALLDESLAIPYEMQRLIRSLQQDFAIAPAAVYTTRLTVWRGTD